MFITSREKSIIDLIVRTSGKHTVHSLASFLKVSVRTIQRDLKSIEKILQQFNLELNRNANDGLFIDGKNENIFRLIQELTGVNPTDETPEERKLRLLITLLHEGPSIKQQVLANELGVSGTTLSAYLDDLAEWLNKFSIILTRKRGVGVELIAEEANKRHALTSYFLVYFYEELIENLYLLEQGEELKGKILGYFSPQNLIVIDRLVNQTINKGQTRLSDSDYIGLILHICLTLQRTQNGFMLKEYKSENEATSEFQLMKNICEELKEKLSIPITNSDVHFLTIILKGSKFHDAEVAYYDSVQLGKLIKNIIHGVSSMLNVDLSNDFSLFQGLLAHMEPSIFRLKQQLELFNPLTEEIKRKYPFLFMAVKKSMEKEFKDIDFPDDEIAFIVLHFGSALLMHEEKVRINAVVVCPTGIGASKMLASRIQKELSEITNVDILSIKDFESANLDKYDLVISTVRLPFTDVEYILVSPLLSEKDIGFIQNYLQNNLEKLTRKNQYLNSKEKQDTLPVTSQQDVKDLLQEIKDVHTSMDSILQNLKVYQTQTVRDHWKVLKEMIEQAEQEGLLTNSPNVMQQLEEREKKGGLGIPNTNMGLFHCRDDNVRELIFRVSHLDHSCKIMGMDGQEMQMKNLLLMLAPENMSKREQEILSIISTSLIESDVAMMIFSSSNEAIIRKKLEDLFLDYLKNNLIKE
ncbi:transcriptional regulator MtlR [Thalassobacillus devorans]|uniref:Transcriptional regulator MtlR n=1 Tax=Thalassobacillus devorans TaxID=279813 RepID=A0ABQ1PIP1_9BACI|nr:transcription antiterminator [Thalassobacillus devorans]NIK30035.1 mannitol operon transcriptional antiterminator [Thalassobacillus devorans]GGC97806.1 transcriptional regulator MtlR [Thalassobacillus devorans]